MNEFEALVEEHRGVLRLHCYRMLGSSHDGDDMVQETLVRAFRSRHTLEDPSAARAWLYRIATNVCLDELRDRPRRARGPELGPPSDPDQPVGDRTPDGEWIEPCPSAWLVEMDPAAEYSLKESVALAFVAALQVLTPPQRAVLLLRDVVGLSAEETAKALACSVSAANSTLHRARAALDARVGPRGSWCAEPDAPVDRALLERYLRAWESGDLDTIVGLLHEEATLSMPPSPTWVRGRPAITRFFQRRLEDAIERLRFRAVATAANGCAAIGFYRLGDEERRRLFGLQVIEVRGGLIVGIDHFMTKSAHQAFFRTGLPETLAP